MRYLLGISGAEFEDFRYPAGTTCETWKGKVDLMKSGHFRFLPWFDCPRQEFEADQVAGKFDVSMGQVMSELKQD